MIQSCQLAHPGEVLQDWLEGMPVTEVARHLGVSRVALSRVLHGQSGVSPGMSLKGFGHVSRSVSQDAGELRFLDCVEEEAKEGCAVEAGGIAYRYH